MEFKSLKVNTVTREGSGAKIANGFIEAIKKTLAMPIYTEKGFSLAIDELKNHLGYTGKAKTSSLVWCLNKQLKQYQLKAGVREKGTRIAFFKIEKES